MPKAARSFRLTPVERELSDADLDAVVGAALRRARLVDDLKEALMAHDTSRVYEAGWKVCGLEAEKGP